MRLQRCLFILLALVLPAVQAALLAIDYGAEFTKLSLVKPGIPFDVLLDRDSRRKISSVVGWKRKDRVFGAEGKMSSTRFPNTHYPYVKPLLATTEVQTPAIYPNPPIVNEHGQLIFAHPDIPEFIVPKPLLEEQAWTPTALLAHQIAYFRALAEEAADGETITQAVVTVPALWTQQQRRAYRDALELQGMSCLAMIGEGTGVALNYAMTRTFPDYDPETGLGNKQYEVVYDSGAFATSATVFALYQTSYRPSPKSKTLINTTHIDVMAVGNEDVGGVHLDLAVRDMLVADFIKQSGKKDVVNDPRAMAKLLKEAVRVKQILSANQMTLVNIESLYNDIDFRTQMTRIALEEKFVDSVDRFTAPVTQALEAANLTLEDVESVILFGGNSRVPFVQSAVRAALGDNEDKIAQGVNTDEASVLGAAFYGAGLSRQFKMKQIEVQERASYDFSLGDEVIFPAGSPLGEKKSLLLKPEVGEEGLEITQNGNPVLSVVLPELAQVLSNFTAPSPVLNLTVRLDTKGIFSVANAAIVSNDTVKDDGGVANALKGLFGKKKEDTEGDEATEGDNTTETKPATKAPRAPVVFREKALGSKPLTREEKRETHSRLRSVATFEAAMRAREEARNMLEGYLYRLQNLLSTDADNRAVHDFTTAEERKNIQSLVEQTFEWLHEHADDADVETLLGKRIAIETLEHPVTVRFTEWRTRGKSVEDFQKAMWAGRSFLVDAAKNVTEAKAAAEAAPADKPVAPPKYTDEELAAIKDLLKDNEDWVDPLMSEQAKIEKDKTKDPLIFSKDLDERGKKVQAAVHKLLKKKAPRAPRPPKPSTTASAVAEEETGSAEPAEEKEEEVKQEEIKEEEVKEEGSVPKHEEL